MKFKIISRPRIRNSMAQKLISSSLAIGLIFNSTSASLASILSEDKRYETFEGNNITIDNILKEDKVDVEIEGNTMVNVANQKDPVPITKSYTVENTNHIPLQGEYDGKARPVIEGNTLYYNNDTGELTDTFIEGANLSLVSSFEDQLVTQEMVNNGEEKPENLGKYKVEYKVTGKNKFNTDISIRPDLNDSVDSYSNNEIVMHTYINSQYIFIPVLEYKCKPNTNYTLSYKVEKLKNSSTANIKVFAPTYHNIGTDGFELCFGKNGEDSVITFNTQGYDTFYILAYTVSSEATGYEENHVRFYDIQLEEGTTATEYEPYKESIKTFYLNSPLLEGDTIEDIDGKATHIRRSEKIVLDGSEDWAKGNVYGDSHQFVISRPSNMKSESAVMSNSLKSQHNVSEIGTCYSGNLYFNVFMPETTTIEYKQWLSENPMTVVYELAEPIYEIISEESILINSYKDGHLDLNTCIPVNKVDFIPTTTNLNYLYPSTEYTIQFESDNKGKIEEVLLGDEVLYGNYSVSKGINRFNITTSSEISSTELTLDGIGFNLSNLVATEAVDESFDYFEGIKSVGQDDENGHKIEIVSNNLDKTQSNTLQIPLSEPLRGLPNGAKDRIIKRNGQWVIERNCAEIMLDGSEDWSIRYYSTDDVNKYIYDYTLPKKSTSDNDFDIKAISNTLPYDNSSYYVDDWSIKISEYGEQLILRTDINIDSTEKLIEYLSNNPMRLVYRLENPIYESLNIDLSLYSYLDTTHISNDSTVPANMKVVIDRAINKAVEAIELAKINPTISNISEARYWTNLLKESIKKDELQGEISSITDIEDLQLEKKTATSNLDVYIKSENMLSMSLSTNSITFNDYSGVEDVELNNAVNISINSSLPYQLNSYLLTEIENSDKSSIIEKDLLNIKSSSDIDYKTFNDIDDKLVLENSCDAGNNKSHSVDLKLKGSQAHKADIYKAVIKFEAEQK